MLAAVEAMEGVKVLGIMDDDRLTVGNADNSPWTFYIMADVRDFDTAGRGVQSVSHDAGRRIQPVALRQDRSAGRPRAASAAATCERGVNAATREAMSATEHEAMNANPDTLRRLSERLAALEAEAAVRRTIARYMALCDVPGRRARRRDARRAVCRRRALGRHRPAVREQVRMPEGSRGDTRDADALPAAVAAFLGERALPHVGDDRRSTPTTRRAAGSCCRRRAMSTRRRN